MAPYLFWELLILIVGVGLIAIMFFVYGWILLNRQKKMIQSVLELLGPRIPETRANEEPPKQIKISKNEPIGKFKDMPVDDNVEISFVDEDK